MMAIKTASKWFVLCVILTAPLLYVIDVFIINIAISSIKSGLNATDGEIQLVIAAYLLGSACFLITGSRVGDYMGKKKTFFWGMFFFTLTSCICGVCQTGMQLDIARFFQGISSAFMVTQSISLIQVLFPDAKERAKAIGWYGITLSIAAIIGQILGGYLAGTHLAIEGWRLIFFVNIPVGGVALWAIKKFLKETEKTTNVTFDYSGAIILTIALGCLIYSITEGREQGWRWWSIMLILLAIILIFYFIRNQKIKLLHNKSPLIDMKLFKQKEFNIGLLAVLFHFMLHTAYLLMMAVFLQNGLGLSALQCGMCFVPHALLFMLSSIIAPKLMIKYGKGILQFGLLIIFISFALQLFFSTAPNNIFLSILFIAIYGLGNGLVLPFLLNIVLNNIAIENAGVASGIFSTFQQTASALGIGIIGGIFYTSLEEKSINPGYAHALNMGLAAEIASLIIVAIMLYLLPPALKNKSLQLSVE